MVQMSLAHWLQKHKSSHHNGKWNQNPGTQVPVLCILVSLSRRLSRLDSLSLPQRTVSVHTDG